MYRLTIQVEEERVLCAERAVGAKIRYVAVSFRLNTMEASSLV